MSCCALCVSALALSFPEQMATSPARERLKLGLRLPTTRSKLFLWQLSARSPGRRHSTSRAAQGSRKVRPGPAGSRPRADAIRRAAERSCRAAERSCRTERPRSRALSPRRLRLGLLADGRLQRARIRRLRTPTRGICRRVTGVFSAPTRGLSAGGFPEHLSVLQRACLPLRDPR